MKSTVSGIYYVEARVTQKIERPLQDHSSLSCSKLRSPRAVREWQRESGVVASALAVGTSMRDVPCRTLPYRVQPDVKQTLEQGHEL